MTDDERRPLSLGQCGVESLADGVDIAAVNLDDVPVPSAVFGSRILGHHLRNGGRQLDVVGVVEHDEVVQSEFAGNTADALRDFLLNAAVRDVGIDMVLHYLMSETGLKEPLGHGSACSEGMPLTERT